MKKILIVSHALELGGAERALLGLLDALDKEKYQIDLFLLRHSGALLNYIPDGINLLPEIPQYAALLSPIKKAIKEKQFGVVAGRLKGKLFAKRYCKHYGLPPENDVACQYAHKYATPYLPVLSTEQYDMAISFLTPHYIVADLVYASKKVAWIHTDYSQIVTDFQTELKMWEKYDRIASISDCVSASFVSVFPPLKDRLIRIDNILVPEWIYEQANAFAADDEMQKNGSIRLLSIGRFCTPKNFDNIPDICKRLRAKGNDVIWYLIGFGSDETLIRERIESAGMEDYVIILGRKENPYPYIKACDLYVQPSRYEGNAVAVHEAQILGKPVVISDYPTAKSQIQDGENGIIVPLDNEKCADGISRLLNDTNMMKRLASNGKSFQNDTQKQLKQLYSLVT